MQPAPTQSTWPADAAARDRFVLDRRPPRPRHDPWRHQGVSVEDERDSDGTPARVATVFLTGRECPWRCAMCDLWQYTIAEDTPSGAIPAQIADARRDLRARGDDGIAQAMKLYNAGSFFDPRAVPERDYDAIAAQLAGLTRVIVESHPALIGPRVDRFLAALASHGGVSTKRDPDQGETRIARSHGRDRAVETRLEVAMGLETAHPEALERLHKRFTLDGFARAAASLRQRDVDLRVFLLIAPPFIPPDAQEAWLLRSVDAAFACGASVVSLVPTRPGNGAIEALAAEGAYRAPRLEDVEQAAAAAIGHAVGRGVGRGRVFVDLWDLERFSDCPACIDARRARLHAMNLAQRVSAPAGGWRTCEDCASRVPS